MAIDILDALKSAFGSPVTRQVGTFFGDSEEATRSGLRSSFSALLAGVLHKSNAPGGAQDVYRAVTSDTVDPGLPSRVGSLLGNRGSLEAQLGSGESLLSSIFGSRSTGVAQAISEVSGVRPSSATGLLALAAPMLMGVLKKYVTQNNLDARGLSSLLLSQRSSLQGAGLDSRITSAMGIPNLQSLFGTSAAPEEPREFGTANTGYTRAEHHAPSGAYARPVPDRPRGRWVPWAIAAAVAIGLLGFLSTRLGQREQTPVAAATSLPASVYFDVGRADLTSDGQRMVKSVAVSVRSSAAPVAVTGYADSSGNPDQNAQLARNRAEAVRDALVREGVAPARVVMAPPTSVTPGAPADESRRVDIRIAVAPDGTGVPR